MKMKTTTQDTASLRSSSSFRDSISPATTTAHHHVKTVNVGCMSGIFHLVSKYHTRRKFLTFGRKQDKSAPSPPNPDHGKKVRTPPKPETVTCPSHDQPTLTKLSLEVPRSPSLPPQIRISSGGSSTSPRVVARLMGLDDIVNVVPPSPPSTAAEKRRKLLGALEKCDEDLKALKRIIEAVRATQTPPRAVVVGGGRKKWGVEREDEEIMECDEEPSPVSVLDHHHHQSPPSSGCSKRSRNGQMLKQQQQQQQQQQQHQQQQQQQQKQQRQQQQKQQRQQITLSSKKPGDNEDNASFRFLHKPPTIMPMFTNTSQSLHVPISTRETPPSSSSSSTKPWRGAMKESVTEVCRDVAWGQQREIGRIALLIQDFIYADLVEEIIKDLISLNLRGYSSSSRYYLLFDACKRQLCF